jgi:hypothetical protein
MNRRIGAVIGGSLAVLAVVLVGPRGAQADDRDAARTLLDHSRDAANHHEFSGIVLVEWLEGGQRRERTIPVEVGDGVLHMGNDRLLSAGTRRVLRTDQGWQLLWAGRSQRPEPDPGGKYRFDVTSGATVAKRPATQVAISRAGSTGVRERMYFDDATGMLLRRDQIDGRGRLVRRFAFVKLTSPQPVDGSGIDRLPKVNQQSRADVPDELAKVPDGLQAPKHIGRGFVLTGVYSQPDGSVQLYYSDGLLGLSVFERTGELAWDELPAGGRAMELGGTRTRVYATSAGLAVVWESDGVTYTCVTDASLDEIRAIADHLANDDDPDVIEDIGRFVTAPFNWG